MRYEDKQATYDLSAQNWEQLSSVLGRLQEDFNVWHDHNFKDSNELETIAGLAEEAGEVCRAAVKMSQGIRGTREDWMDELEKECGDVFIKLMDVAGFYGFDLTTAIQARWKSVRQRNWVDDPSKGGQ
jgi:NTP pyrophosphatase (non-canonical NTP hydrolase)